MSATPTTPQAGADSPQGTPPLVHVKMVDRPWARIRLPWEKVLIWGLFLVLVYALRHFFFIIFMTFIVSYIMRSVVRRISRFVLPGRENVWLERGFTVAGFAVLLFGLYMAGNYIGPELYRQGTALFARVTQVEPEKTLNEILTKTLGSYLFQRKYGGQDDPRYKAGLEELRQGEGLVKAEYLQFQLIVESLEERFKVDEAGKIKARLTEKDFEAWFIRLKAPAVYASGRDAYIARCEERYEQAAVFAGLPPLAEKRKEPDYEVFREQKILEMIAREYLDRTSKDYGGFRAEWDTYAVKEALAALAGSGEYERRFREHYERLMRSDAPVGPGGKPPYPYARFVELKTAHEKGMEAFLAAVQDVAVPSSEEDRLTQARAAFELKETRALLKEFSEGEVFKRMGETSSTYVETGLKALAAWVQGTIAYVVTIPIQLALSLLLSLFITLDIPRLRRGILSLKQSRVQGLFEEIAPGLYNFGRLIGRAFQAQGVIAIFNTFLTFVAIRALGIQNEIFLCALVFLCSFIPVLGVVLSSVPIAIMAIVQPGGTLLLALEAIAAILVIHFIETSVLNPKILGDMLHLHPVLVLAVLAIGQHFFRVWGLLLAVPVTVFIIRCVILDEEIPGLIEQDPLAKVSKAAAAPAAAQDAAPQLGLKGEAAGVGAKVPAGAGAGTGRG